MSEKIILHSNPPREYYHYHNDLENNRIYVYALPYKLYYRKGRVQVMKLIDFTTSTSSNKVYFKTMITIPPIKLELEEKLIQKIKTLLLFS